jgi:hypothetical protein
LFAPVLRNPSKAPVLEYRTFSQSFSTRKRVGLDEMKLGLRPPEKIL